MASSSSSSMTRDSSSSLDFDELTCCSVYISKSIQTKQTKTKWKLITNIKEEFRTVIPIRLAGTMGSMLDDRRPRISSMVYTRDLLPVVITDDPVVCCSVKLLMTTDSLDSLSSFFWNQEDKWNWRQAHSLIWSLSSKMIRMQCQEDNESTCGGQMQMGWCESSRRKHNLDVVSALMADEKLTLFKRLLVEFYSGMPLPSYTLGNCYPPVRSSSLSWHLPTANQVLISLSVEGGLRGFFLGSLKKKMRKSFAFCKAYFDFMWKPNWKSDLRWADLAGPKSLIDQGSLFICTETMVVVVVVVVGVGQMPLRELAVHL